MALYAPAMVALPASFFAFTFQSGIDTIRAAFRASAATMNEAHQQAKQAHIQYLDSGEDDSEYDEEGALLSSTRLELGWAEEEALSAGIVVREAFVTSAFHYWERWAHHRTAWNNSTASKDKKTPKIDFKELTKRVRALGYSISDDLCLLNSLNNLIKHDNPDRGREVFAKRKDLFLFGRKPAADWHGALMLTDEDVEHFLEVVRASGPQPGA